MFDDDKTVFMHAVVDDLNLKTPTKAHLKKLHNHKMLTYFAMFCAEQAFHLVGAEHKGLVRNLLDCIAAYIECEQGVTRKHVRNPYVALGGQPSSSTSSSVSDAVRAALFAASTAANDKSSPTLADTAYMGTWDRPATPELDWAVTSAKGASKSALHAIGSFTCCIGNTSGARAQVRKALQEQQTYYNELLGFDKFFEETVFLEQEREGEGD